MAAELAQEERLGGGVDGPSAGERAPRSHGGASQGAQVLEDRGTALLGSLVAHGTTRMRACADRRTTSTKRAIASLRPVAAATITSRPPPLGRGARDRQADERATERQRDEAAQRPSWSKLSLRHPVRNAAGVAQLDVGGANSGPEEICMKPALIVHGGCGTPPAEEESARDRPASGRPTRAGRCCSRAAARSTRCEAAVRVLEDEPLLNAGTGSYLQADGVARLDASIMAGDGRAGAVAQVPGLKNPIRLARYLLEQDAHVMLSGREALDAGVAARARARGRGHAGQDRLLARPPRRGLPTTSTTRAWRAAWKRENPRGSARWAAWPSTRRAAWPPAPRPAAPASATPAAWATPR